MASFHNAIITPCQYNMPASERFTFDDNIIISNHLKNNQIWWSENDWTLFYKVFQVLWTACSNASVVLVNSIHY